MSTKKILGFILFLITLGSVQAASITVYPFEMELLIQKGYDLKGQVELACRYEKFVLGDSAQYETFTKGPVKLRIEREDEGEFKRVRLVSKNRLYFEYDEYFKYGKECRASFKVIFYSEKYALGHTIKPKSPVSFTLWKGFYDYQEGDQVYDLNKMRKYLDQTTYTFTERTTSQNYYIIRILQDGKEAQTSPWVEKAYLNPQTGRPYPPVLP